MNCKLISFIVSTLIVVTAAKEMGKKSEPNLFCDQILKMLINDEEKLLIDYLIQNELHDEYESRNDDNEMCVHFVSSLMQRIYKLNNSAHKLKKKDDELQTILDSSEVSRKKRYRGVAGRPSKTTFKVNKNSKNNKINPFSLY